MTCVPPTGGTDYICTGENLFGVCTEVQVGTSYSDWVPDDWCRRSSSGTLTLNEYRGIRYTAKNASAEICDLVEHKSEVYVSAQFGHWDGDGDGLVEGESSQSESITITSQFPIFNALQSETQSRKWSCSVGPEGENFRWET
jgi:hypothetical protein